MDKSKQAKYIIAAVSFLVISAAIYFLFIFSRGPSEIDSGERVSEIKQFTEIELAKRPYVTLTPTSDGAEIIISIENMSEFDSVEYELTYLADNPQISGEKIQRGSTGTDVDTKAEKYKKSMLLGTASKGTRSPDLGVSDGKLALHMFKGDIEYLSESNWDLYEIGAKATEIKDRDGKFTVALPVLGKDYWMILADTVGIPKTDKFDITNASLPLYGTFSIAPKFAKAAKITITTDLQAAKLFAYSNQESKWDEIKSTLQNGQITATVDSFSTFVLVSSK